VLKADDVNLDVGEMIMTVGKEPETIEYNKLEKLVMSVEPVKKLFSTKEVKKIEVHVRGKDETYCIASDKVADYNNIEEYLLQMAKKYQIEVDR